VTTAPDESLTTPEIVLCADAREGNSKHGKVRKKAVATNSAQLVARRKRICFI
jgi:hypothetical protein